MLALRSVRSCMSALQNPIFLIKSPHRGMASTMRGVLIEKTGGVEVLQNRSDLPVPTPKSGEVLVKNAFSGVNYIDTYFRTGLYPPTLPEILGKEGAGTVVSIGEGVKDLSENDRVVWMANKGYAAYTTVPAEKAAKIPPGVSEKDACAAFLQGLTALTLVEESHKVQKGDWVLVLAASGGVGGWLLRSLKAIGAHTIATVGSAPKAKLAEDAGAEVVLVEADLGDDGIKKAVLEHTSNEGVAAVFDGVGQATFERSLDLVARKGSLVSFGNASGAVEPLRIAKLAPKNVKLTRPQLFGYIKTREEFNYYSEKLWALMKNEKIAPNIWKVYPFEDVAQAHQDLESRKTTGKLLLTP